MSVPDPYLVRPWSVPCRGSVSLPGSKSLTNRALILAALSAQTVRIEQALFSRDSLLLIANLKKLGFEVMDNAEARSIGVNGQGGRIPVSEAELFVGNAGTAARFLTALVCLHPEGTYHFDGDKEMYPRPMEGLIHTLQKHGAEFTFHKDPNHFPFTVRTHGLRGGSWEVDASASSQMLSALMMVAPYAEVDVQLSAIGARPAFVRMTARQMEQFGVNLSGDPESGYAIASGQQNTIGSDSYAVEPDVSAASYFMTLPVVTGGSLLVEGLKEGMLQGDVAYTGVLEQLGVKIEKDPSGWRFHAPELLSSFPPPFDFQFFSDTFLTLAAVSPLLPWPVSITGIGHTRYQETDRISAMATELQRLGLEVNEQPTALTIQPASAGFPADPGPVAVETYHDHRVAMAFAILGCSRRGGTSPWLAIRNPACAGKTFPAFFEELDRLYTFCHDN